MSTENDLCQIDPILFNFERAQDLRRSNMGRFCDLTIQSTANDNKTFIHCHRVILASVSPFFKEILLEDETKKTLDIPDVEHETLEILVNYMYRAGGLITLNTENVFKIFTGAEYLKLNQLVTSCLEFIKSSITFKDVVQIFKFALTANLPTLSKTCMHFIIINFEQVKSFGFLDLDFQQVNILLEHAIESQTLAMADILLAVSEWLHSNKEERLEHAFSLISKIPLSKIRLKNLRRLLREDNFLMNIPEVLSLYMDTVEEMGLRFEQAQIEKRKAEEMRDVKEETAVTDCEPPSEPVSSKRRRFSAGNECTSDNTFESSDVDHRLRTNIGLIENNVEVETTHTSFERKEKAVVYFIAKKVTRSEFQNSIVSFDLETKEFGILGPILDSDYHIYARLVYHLHKLYVLRDVKKRNGVRCNPVVVFNITSKRWEENVPNHVEVSNGFEAVVVGEYLYAIGGWAQSGKSCNMERLKIQNPFKQWEAVAQVPISSGEFGICVANGCIYLMGGITNVRSNSPAMNSAVLCYTPESDKWVIKRNMLIPRRGFALAVVSRHIYVLGGSSSTTAYENNCYASTSVYIYDTEMDSWNKGDYMKKCRKNFSAIVHNNCIYAIGGDSSHRPTMERFSLERQVWEDMGSIPESGLYHSAVLHVEELI